MKIYDILTKWILKTYSMQEKYVQILYSSINNSKICSKLTKPIDWMGRIRTAYILCTHITLETTALRVKASLAKDRCFSRSPGVCFRVFLRFQEGFSNFWKIVIFHHVWVQKIVHEPNPLNGPYSAHILWKCMIFWPNESSRRILCRKNMYRFCTA